METTAVRVELRGYRWWRCGRRGILRSPWFGRHVWEPGVNLARCSVHTTVTDRIRRRQPQDGRIPHEFCRCGFYATTLLPDAGGWPTPSPRIDMSSSGIGHAMVFGVAQAAGSVLLTERGWRAGKATVRALYISPGSTLDVGALWERYDAPVYRDLEALATEWGPSGEVEELFAA
jgi:hypothetical protein